MLPIDRKAYTIRSDNYPTIIIINGRYEHKSQLVLCAHELGHALLHSDDINNFETAVGRLTAVLNNITSTRSTGSISKRKSRITELAARINNYS